MEATQVEASTNQRTLEGVLPVFNLPYHEDESIDYDTLLTQINWAYDQGANGLVMAMVSEVLRLSDVERQAVAEFICQHGRQRGAVVVSVGAESSYSASEHMRHAESVGADAVMAIPPVSTALGEVELRRYYERILKAGSIPVIVQDASGYVGQPMSINLQADLLHDFGQRILFKPEATPIGPRLTALRDATDGQARIFEGTGGIALLDSHRRGIVGTMPGVDLLPGLVALWHALEDGNETRSYELSLPISSLIAMLNSLDSFIAVEKHLLVKQGVFKNTIVRGPTAYTLDDETRREVDRRFELIMAALQPPPPV